MEGLPSFNKLCVCQCNDIVSSWEQVLFVDFGKSGEPTWHDEDGEEFPAIVSSWKYKMTNIDRP